MNTNVLLKNCIDCGRQYKPTGARQKRCIACGKAHHEAYQKTSEYKAWRKAYRQTSEYKAAQKEYDKSYYQSSYGKAKRKNDAKAYQQRPEYKAYRKAYEQSPNRKTYKKILKNKRNSRKKNLPSTFTIGDWRHAIKYFRHTCAYCGEFSQDLHQEHFIPVVSDGGYTPDNIVPACPKCNLQKHTKPAREFLNEIGHVERYEMIVSYLQARTAG